MLDATVGFDKGGYMKIISAQITNSMFLEYGPTAMREARADIIARWNNRRATDTEVM